MNQGQAHDLGQIDGPYIRDSAENYDLGPPASEQPDLPKWLKDAWAEDLKALAE